MTSVYHEPVLVEEVLDLWVTNPRGRYLDGTVGGGGHAEALLSRYPEASLLGLDRDPDALRAAEARLRHFGSRVTLTQSNFSDLESALELCPGPAPAGVLFDVGVSSYQLDTAERGFSYAAEAALRLTLNPQDPDARDYLDAVTAEELKRVFRELADLPQAGRAARAVLRAREEGRLETTAQFADVLRKAGSGSPRRLSQAFQALRMAVNDELESLEQGMVAAARVLPEDGVLCVISFESVMDRKVKTTFKPPVESKPLPTLEPDRPVWEVMTRKVVRPSEEEVQRNVRSRSARLRAARRTAHAL